MGTVQWDVTVSEELNSKAITYLAQEGEGVEGLSHLVERAVGTFLKDPEAADRSGGITEGELNDLIAAAVAKVKEKYSGITAGELNDMVNAGIENFKKTLGKK